MRKTVAEYTAITLGGFLYALGVHFFIFAGDIVLGGTGGISVILEQFLPFSPNDIITVINLLLLLFAFLFLVPTTSAFLAAIPRNTIHDTNARITRITANIQNRREPTRNCPFESSPGFFVLMKRISLPKVFTSL